MKQGLLMIKRESALFSSSIPANRLAALSHALKWTPLLIFFGSGVVHAKEIYFEPSVQLNTEYDDNKRLWIDRFSNVIDTSAYGVIASAAARVGVRSDLYDISLNNKVEIKRYDSDLDLDSENAYFDLASSFNVTQRNQFGIDGNYTHDTTLTGEFDAAVLVQENIIRDRWYIRPHWTYFLSDTQQLSADYSHYDSSYEQTTINQYFDYTTDSVSLTYIQQWTEQLKNYLSVSWLMFEVPDVNRETTQYTVNLGGDYQFLPTWSVSFMVGGRFTNTEVTVPGNVFTIPQLQFDQNGNLVIDGDGNPVFVDTIISTQETTISDNAQGMIFSFSLNKRFLSGSAGISYSRETSPQGNGRLLLLDKFNANVSHKITQNLRLSLNGGINVYSSSGSQSGNDQISNFTYTDRTYYYVRPSVSWLFDRHTSVTAGYQYRRREFDNRNNDSGESNAFFVGFNYQWDKLATQEY